MMMLRKSNVIASGQRTKTFAILTTLVHLMPLPVRTQPPGLLEKITRKRSAKDSAELIHFIRPISAKSK